MIIAMDTTMTWINLGDMNPKSGTFLARNASINQRGDFEAEIVDVIPESNVGGDDSRFLLRRGAMYLNADNFDSALATLGQRLDGDHIIASDHSGGEIRIAICSPEGFIELAQAANAYAGIDDVDITSLVQIGEDDDYSADRKFTGDLLVFPEGTSLWAIMDRQLEGLEFEEKFEPAVPIRVIEDEDSSLGL